MKILVTGSKGQLGSEIHFLHQQFSRHTFTFTDIKEFDLSSTEKINKYLEHADFDIIINCAAFTNVDGAEDNHELANQINHLATKSLAEFCKKNNKRLIHISTDYIFNGVFNIPITETDRPDPQSVYGKTKLDGENAISAILNNAYIIRTSWVYSSFGNNFVKTMLSLGKTKDQLNVVADQIGTPTYARDLASTILNIIDNLDEVDKPGIYHFSNEGVCSWYDFAYEVMKLRKIDCQVNPIPTSEFPTKAKRPSFSLLNKSKIKSTFDINIDHWTKSLERCLKELES